MRSAIRSELIEELIDLADAEDEVAGEKLEMAENEKLVRSAASEYA